jgi:rhodanese-related sulfurtransferase
MTAASILEQAGRHNVSVLVGGASEWAAAHEISLETST